MLSPGDRFEGYVVDAALGHGGYATVYRAHDAADPDRVVALKVLDDHHRQPAQIARLQREFDFAHRLDHPHIIKVYERGPGWLSMELIDGGTVAELRPLVRSAGRAGPDRRCAGLRPRSRHRALRRQAIQYPCIAALFGTRRGAHRLRRRARGCRGRAATDPRTSRRRCPTRPPSCCTGHAPSAATDEYALACTAFELITGSPPFTATTSMGSDRRAAARPRHRRSRADRLAAARVRLDHGQGLGERPGQQIRIVLGVRLADHQGACSKPDGAEPAMECSCGSAGCGTSAPRRVGLRRRLPERCSSRTKSATDSVSPRRDGSILAASSRRADSLPEPAHSANALRDVLRRCANAMSISSNTWARKPASVGHGDASWRSMRTSPSTPAESARTPSATPCRSAGRCRRTGP